jgi:uncharacterized membrane protein
MALDSSPARRVALAGVIGALYVVLSITPFSYGPIQFRIGEALKPLVIRYPATIPAFGIGTVIINLFSPFAGVLELAFMPAVDVIGGALCWFVAHRVGGALGTYLASLLYALFTAAGVGVVLSVVAGLPYLASFASVAVSEVILLLVGNALLVRRIYSGLWRG